MFRVRYGDIAHVPIGFAEEIRSRNYSERLTRTE